MPKKSGVKLPQVHEPAGQVVIPPIKAGPLNKQGGVRRLHSRVIKAALRGEISVEEMSKLSYAMTNHSKIIENETLSDRLDRLEKAMEGTHEH